MTNNQNVVQLIIEGNNVTAIKAVDGTITKLNQMGNKAKEAQGPVDKLANALGLTTAQFSVGAAVAGLTLLVKNAIDTADEMSKTAQKIGTTTENISTLKYAADLADVSFEELTKGLAKLSKGMFDVNNGVGQTTKLGFDALGIKVVDANNKLRDTNDVLLDVADKFKSMPDSANKTAIAMTLFGRSGMNLIPMLNAGKDGIQDLQAEARKLGVEISSSFGRQAEEFNDNLTRMNYALQGVGIRIAADLLPSLSAISIALVQISSDSNNTMPLVTLLGASIKSIATALGGVAVGAIVAGEALGTYWAAMAKAATLDFPGAVKVIETGFKQIETTALQAGKIFDAMWNPSKFEDQFKAISAISDLENERMKSKQTGEQWIAQQQKLNNDMISAGLSEQSKKIVALITQANEYKKKFGEIPSALATIDNWFEKMVGSQTTIKPIDIPIKFSMPFTQEGVTFAREQAGLFGEAFYNQLSLDASAFKESNVINNSLTFTPDIDLTKFLAAKAIMEQGFSDITESSMIHFTLMQEGVSDIFDNMAGAAENVYIAMSEKNRAFFDIYKAFSIAQASIDTYKAAVAAYQAMVGIPIVGPGLAIAAAAAATAFGLTNVARIASMQPGSRGSSPTASGGSYSIPTARNYNNSTTNNSTTNNNRDVTLIINGDVIDPDQWFRKNRASIRKLFEDGVLEGA